MNDMWNNKYLLNIIIVIVMFYVNYGVLSLPQQSASTVQFKQTDTLPSNLQCHEKDPQLNECIRKNLQYILENLKSGISDINLPVLDPAKIPKVNFDFANNFIKGKVTLENLTLKGISDTKLISFEREAVGDTIHMTSSGVIPKLDISGNHRADLSMNNAKISSKGSFHITLTDLKYKVKLENDLYERDGHMYLNTKHIDFEPTIGDMKLEADGIFQEPALNDAIVNTINENWQEFYKDLVTEARAYWEPSLLKVINNYWSYLPHDLMILKD